MEIKPIRIPTNVIRTLPPVVSNDLPLPVVSGIEVPVVDMPGIVVDYPTIDAPTRETFEADLSQPQQTQQEEPQDRLHRHGGAGHVLAGGGRGLG